MIQTGLLSAERPDKILPLGNGQMTVLYNYDIEEVQTVTDERGSIEVVPGGSEGQETTTMYRYSCVRVEYPITADNIFATLLSEKYPAKVERKLANEYESAQLGILPVEHKKPYEDFLRERVAIRAMVDADCLECNIPIDLPV